MKFILSVILFKGSLLSAYSQVDYHEFKERYNLSCRVPDSAIIVGNQQLMDSLSSLEVVSGAEEFYYDHAWVYYMRYMKWKNKTDLQKAADIWEEGWQEYDCLHCLKSIAGIYRHLDDCTKALDLTELYLEEVPDTDEVDYKEIYMRYRRCRGKE